MRSSPISPLKDSLGELAKVWLAAGASSFSLWSGARCHAEWAERDDDASPLVAPILIDSEPVGELRVGGLSGKAFEARLKADAELASHLAALHRDLQRANAALAETRDELAVMYNLTQQSRSDTEPQQILQALAREAVHRLNIEGAFAVLVPLTGPRMIVQEPEPMLDTDLVFHFFEHAQLSGEEVLLTPDEAHSILDADVESLLFVPIQVGETVLGGLGLINKTGRDFNEHDRKLLWTIAEQAGAQIENLILNQERMEQAKMVTELELARRVQLDLLPEAPPSVAGLDIFGRSRPALHVGGDFFDFVTRPDMPLSVVVGDVSGKGLAAAILMAMTRRTVRSVARFSTAPSPDSFMGYAVEDLYDDFIDVEMFCTLFVALWDPQTRQLTFNNAGHSPVIHCPAAGPARVIMADGPPVGMLPTSLCELQSVTLNPGDILLVGSDGFTEARNEDEDLFGPDNMRRLIEGKSSWTADALGEYVFASITEYGGQHPQNDDQTLVILKGVEAVG